MGILITIQDYRNVISHAVRDKTLMYFEVTIKTAGFEIFKFNYRQIIKIACTAY